MVLKDFLYTKKMQQQKLTSRFGKEWGKLAIASPIGLLSIKSGVSAMTIGESTSAFFATQSNIWYKCTVWPGFPNRQARAALWEYQRR